MRHQGFPQSRRIPAKPCFTLSRACSTKRWHASDQGCRGFPKFFFLVVAGYGEQDVFQREVTAVGQQFEANFKTADHGILLINNPDSVLTRPMASVTALRQSLKIIGKRMNPEDVLFLFMASHGSAQHRFDLSLSPYRFDDLTPDVLRQILDDAGIR